MAKQGEIDYIENIGVDGMRHALNKPFSDPRCGLYFMDLGVLFSLLPAPPARLLDLGTGTGWTSVLFAQKGYDVVGQDIAPAMIDLAHKNQENSGLPNMSFIISDYESLGMEEQFDCAVFYDSLHHAVDEESALRGVYRALKPGGVCITVEPGKGHHLAKDSLNAVQAYGVTEKEMPPHHIIQTAQQVGFSRAKVYQRRFEPALVFDTNPPGIMEHLLKVLPDILYVSRLFRRSRKLLNRSNIVVLYKP